MNTATGYNFVNMSLVFSVYKPIHNRIANSKVLMKIFGNAFWLYLDNLVRLVIGLTVSIFLARYLGPESFGLINYVFAFTAIFALLSSLGLGNIVVRDLVQHPENADTILASNFILLLASGFFTFISAYFIITIVRPDEDVIQFMVAIIALGNVVSAFGCIENWYK